MGSAKAAFRALLKHRNQSRFMRIRLEISLVPNYFAAVGRNLKREISQIDRILVRKQLQNGKMGPLLVGYLNVNEGLVFVADSSFAALKVFR